MSPRTPRSAVDRSWSRSSSKTVAARIASSHLLRPSSVSSTITRTRLDSSRSRVTSPSRRHAVDPVGHRRRREAELLRELARAHPVGRPGDDEGLEDLPLRVADAQGRGLAPVRDVHTSVQAAQGRDDLLDLGVEVLEFALVDGDLLVEARLVDGRGAVGGVTHGSKYRTSSLASNSFDV